MNVGSRIFARAIVPAIFLCLSAVSLFGQFVRTPVQITKVFSQNQRFYLKTIPYDNERPSLRGRTYVYRSTNPKPIYQIDRGFNFLDLANCFLFISDDGDTIMSVIGYGADEKTEALRSVVVYQKGVLVKSYTLAEVTGCDLTAERCELVYWDEDIVNGKKSATAHDRFLEEFAVFQRDGIVYVTDSKKTCHLFDLASGNKLRDVPFSEVFDGFKRKAAKNKTVAQEFASPDLSELPRLRDGRDSVKALAALLGMKPYNISSQDDRQYRRYGIELNVYLLQNGRLEIESIDADDNLPKDKIEQFIKSNRFSTSALPKVFDKWFIGPATVFLRNADDTIARKEREEEKALDAEALAKRMVAESIDGVYIPKDLRDCFVELDKLLKDVDKSEMRALQKRGDMIRFHLGLGMWMRNNWGLWGGSRLQKYFTDKGIRHPDDMSSIVLFYYYDWLTGKQDTWKDFEKNPGSPFGK